jgi:hypothetical protein
MISIITAALFQAAPSATLLEMRETCGERLDCAIALIRPDLSNTPQPDRDEANDVIDQFSGSIMSWASRAAWRWELTGRLDGTEVGTFIVIFQTRGSPCNDTEEPDLYWPFLGYSSEGHPLFLTDHGELEVTSPFPTVGSWDDVLLLVRGRSDSVQPVLSLTDYEHLFFDSSEEIYSRRSSGNCVRLPVHPNERLRAAPEENCRRETDLDPRIPMRSAEGETANAPGDFRQYQIDVLPDYILLDRRIVCT